MTPRLLVAIAAMAIAVVASNILVQYPVQGRIGSVDLAEILTFGAFTYPLAFLVNDLTNRHFGPAIARRVVLVGFIAAILVSVLLASPRIATASGTAFLVAQLLDTAIFHRLRRALWWVGPLVSSVIGAIIDTLLFFAIAFSARFAFLDTAIGREDSSLAFPVPLLSMGPDVPLWISLGAGDLLIKLVMALIMLAPYGALLRLIPDRYLQRSPVPR